ncbi:MAG: hypothetical protein KDD82_31720, partial [Planctomycetes bacterium]|nr:hypothetical protein [Planctomycetota bacterium]
MLRILGALVGLALIVGAQASAEEIRALAGTFDEELISIGGSPLVLKTGQRSVPLSEVKAVRFQPRPSQQKGTKVLLVNGDWVRGVITGGDDESVKLRSPGLGELSLSFDLIRALIPETSPEVERQLEESIKVDSTLDSVVQKDAAYEGAIEAIQPGRVVINTDEDGGTRVGTHSLRLAEVQMVTLALIDEPPPNPSGLHVALYLIDGSRVRGPLLGYQNGVLELKHPLAKGGALAIESSRVAELSVKNGSFVYVSDLDPATFKQEFPSGFVFNPETWGFKRD